MDVLYLPITCSSMSDITTALKKEICDQSSNSRSHKLGAWQLKHIYDGCSNLQSCDCHLQLSQLPSISKVNEGSKLRSRDIPLTIAGDRTHNGRQNCCCKSVGTCDIMLNGYIS